MKFIHKYNTEEEFIEAYSGEEYIEPWVSFTAIKNVASVTTAEGTFPYLGIVQDTHVWGTGDITHPEELGNVVLTEIRNPQVDDPAGYINDPSQPPVETTIISVTYDEASLERHVNYNKRITVHFIADYEHSEVTGFTVPGDVILETPENILTHEFKVQDISGLTSSESCRYYFGTRNKNTGVFVNENIPQGDPDYDTYDYVQIHMPSNNSDTISEVYSNNQAVQDALVDYMGEVGYINVYVIGIYVWA